MIVGTPGTGIGGLFYLLLAAWMPVRQVWSVVTGRAMPGAWKIVASSVAQGSAMLVALFGEAWVIKNCIAPWIDQASSQAGPTAAAKVQLAERMTAVAPAVAVLPLIVLAFVLLAVQVARLLGLSDRGRKERARQQVIVEVQVPAVQPVVVTVEER